MKYLNALAITVFLASCGGSGGDAPDVQVPTVNPGDTSCNGDVSFNTVVPDPSSDSVDSGDSSNDTSTTVPGIINPAVTKAVAQADFQGLKILRMEKVDGATIIATCGSTINIGGDDNNSNNTSGAQ